MDAPLHMVGLSLVFTAMTFVVLAVDGLFASAMRSRALSRPRVVAWMRRSFAATHVLLAGRLALTER